MDVQFDLLKPWIWLLGWAVLCAAFSHEDPAEEGPDKDAAEVGPLEILPGVVRGLFPHCELHWELSSVQST